MTGRKNALISLAIVLIACTAGAIDPPPAARTVTLMGMLSEWLYSDASFNGAESADAMVAEVSSIKSKAVLTTSDSVDDVIAFYLDKLNVDREGTSLDTEDGEPIKTDRAVQIQEVDGALFIINVDEPNSSTTLVISRNADDDTTRIAWSNYRQLWP